MLICVHTYTQCCQCLFNREFNLLMFPNHDIISPGADFIVYSAEGPRKVDFNPSALYKGTLECKEMIMCVNIR